MAPLTTLIVAVKLKCPVVRKSRRAVRAAAELAATIHLFRHRLPVYGGAIPARPNAKLASVPMALTWTTPSPAIPVAPKTQEAPGAQLVSKVVRVPGLFKVIPTVV